MQSNSAHPRALLIVLDGFGIGPDSPHNAIKNARMPFYRDLESKYPRSQLITHGEAVGLPGGVMGNSEVGHMTMGAGRIIYQDLTRISKSIQDREFQKNRTLRETLQTGAAKTGRVHFMGLLSDGGVHSHIDHLLALLDLCVELSVPEAWVHVFTDGRDTSPNSGAGYLKRLLQHPTFQAQGAGGTRARIASISGRYFAMDRDKRWERVERAYRVITGQTAAPEELARLSDQEAPIRAIENSYAAQKTDEFIEPILLRAGGALRDGDSLVFFNYRSDRARELSEAFLKPDFAAFDRGTHPRPSAFCGMTVYDKNLGLPAAFQPQSLKNIFGEWLENHQRTQLRLAETEKYAHVTFFFNGGREAPFAGEERILIASPKDVDTYDLKPEMSAFQVADAAVEQIRSRKFDFMLMNFANADMVGHTGNYAATVRAMEVLDQCLSRVIGAAEKNGYHVLVTADHGNAEEMCDREGHIHTQHTLNPVPAIWVAPDTAIAPRSARQALRDGTLEDVMPTLCQLMSLGIPPEATGKCLLP